MKRNALAMLYILITINSWGQKGFDIGVSGTLNSTWILKQNNYGTLAPFQNEVVRRSDMNYKALIGANVGIVLGYNFTDNWGMRGEVQYDFTGQIYEDNFTGPATIPEGTFGSINQRVNVRRDIRLQYVQVPVMVKFTTTKWEKEKIFVCLGPQFNFRTYAYEQVKIAGYVYRPDSLAFTPGQKFQTFDFGLALQVGADFFIKPNFYIETALSSYIGLTDLNGDVLRQLDWYSKNNVSYRSSHNFRAGLMVGFHYVFKKKENKEELLRY